MSNAMTSAHGDLRDAGRAVREARALLTEVTDRHERLSVHLNTTWREREDLTASYQRLLLGVLRVLDDCAHLGQPAAIAWNGLRALLDEEGVELMPVAPGDPFDGERHRGEATVSGSDLPDGVVVEVIADGYLRRTEDTAVVVRPAMVRVSAGGTA